MHLNTHKMIAWSDFDGNIMQNVMHNKNVGVFVVVSEIFLNQKQQINYR